MSKQRIRIPRAEAFFEVSADNKENPIADPPGLYTDLGDVLVEHLEDLYVAGVNKLPEAKRRGAQKYMPKVWSRFFTWLTQAWTAGCRIGTLYFIRCADGSVALLLPLRWHMSEDEFKNVAEACHAEVAPAVLEVWKEKAATYKQAEVRPVVNGD